MFHFAKIIKVIFILICLNDILYAESITYDIAYELNFIKLLEYGKQKTFTPNSVENISSDINIIDKKLIKV